MKTLRNRITVLFLTTACSTLAHACFPPNYQTMYFGKQQHWDGDLDIKIKQDIAKNHYQIIEERIGLWRVPIIEKDGAIYVNNKVIATKQDSFWYFAHGYYQLNRDLYYMGKFIGRYPIKGSVSTWSENRIDSKPDNFPPNVMYCPVAVHSDILETSDGLHVENLVYDN
jgi:hypothetical protein